MTARTLAAHAIAIVIAVSSPALVCAQDNGLTEQQARDIVETLDDGAVTLAHAGEGETRRIVYTPAFGVTTESRASLTIDTSAEIDDQPTASNAFPPFTATVRTHVQGRSDNDTFFIISTFTDTGIDETHDSAEAMKARMRTYLRNLDGITTHRTLSIAGIPTDNDDVRTSPRADQSLAQRLAQIAHAPVVALPADPVAIGAVWHHRKDSTVDTLEQTEITRYELTDIGEHTVTVSLQKRTLLDPQDLPEDPRTPAMTTRVEQGTGLMLGEITMDLRTGAPTHASLRSNASIQTTITTPLITSDAVQRFFFEISIEPLAPPETQTPLEPARQDAG